MFTYPIVSPGGWPTDEYVLINNPSGEVFYMSVGPGASELIGYTDVGGAIEGGNFTTNGTHLLHANYVGSYGIRILQWDGSTGFTEVGSCYTMPDAVTGGGAFDPVFDANGDIVSTKFVSNTTDTRASSVYTLSGLSGTVAATQDEVTWYTGVSPYTTQARVAGALMDFRRGEDNGKPGYGDLYVIGTTNLNDEAGVICTIEGGSFVFQGYGPTGSSPYGTMQYAGWDRDYHFIVQKVQAAVSSSIYYWDIDVDTPAIGTRETLSVPGGYDVLAAAAVNGFIVLWEEDASGNSTIRTYSKSGSTLTQLDSVAIAGNNNANASFAVSPFTKYVYNYGVTNISNTCAAWSIDKTTGAITKVTDLAQPVVNTSGLFRKGFQAFLEPLPSAP